MTSRARRTFDYADPDVKGYPLLTALVVPRPIAWVSTVSADGVGNLAPHSLFTVACADPGTVQFTSIGAKDTLHNVLETRVAESPGVARVPVAQHGRPRQLDRGPRHSARRHAATAARGRPDPMTP